MLSLTGRVAGRVPRSLQTFTFDPSVLIESPGPERAAVLFVLSVLFGGFVLYRYGGRMDDAVDASRSKPLKSLLYGFVGFVIGVVIAVFAATQMIGFSGGNAVVSILAVAIIGVVASTLSGAGFAVVGAWLSGNLGVGDQWTGLVTVSAGVALPWAVLPIVAAAPLWIATAAAGIGGTTRLWIHQDSEAIYDT